MSSSTDASSASPSLAVIIACSAVGGIIFMFIVVRVGLCIHRRRVLKPSPFPPIRPLSVPYDKPWNSSHLRSANKLNLSVPSLGVYHPADPFMSQACSPRRQSISRRFSMSTEEMPLRQPPSPVTPYSAGTLGAQLVPPQPSFFSPSGSNSNRSSAQLSLNSSTEESDIGLYPPQRHQSMAHLPIIPLPEGAIATVQNSSRQQTRGRSRRLSGSASVSSNSHSFVTSRGVRSSRSLSTIRGAPHAPHNRIEILLPAPLAPQRYPYSFMNGENVYYRSEMKDGISDFVSSCRQSMCDPRLTVGRESISPPHMDKSRRRRTADFPMRLDPRSRPSGQSVSSPPSQATPSVMSSTDYTSRSPSVSSHSRSLRRKTSAELKRLPPVPRVPSLYNNSPSSSSPSLSVRLEGRDAARCS